MNYIKFLSAGALLAVFISSALINGCNAREGQPQPSSATAPPIAQDPREASILTNLVQLTHDFDRAGEAYFSPDMKWIVFQASPHGQMHYQMYLAQLIWQGDRLVGAQKPIRISPENSRNTCGFFSADGKSLIFASTAGKENPNEIEGGYQRQGRNYRWEFPNGMDIYRTDNWLSKIQAAHGHDVNFAVHALTNNNVYDAEDAFSPDGKWICFTSLRSTDGDIYVMRSDGSNPVQITNNPGYDGGPFFSPDGKRLIYRSDRQKNDLLQIYIADLAFDAQGNITGKSAEHELTHDQFVNWGPYWYPDNRHIIFATSRQGHDNYELYAIRDDGTHDVRITYTAGPDILPVFSPDGKYLMWTCKRSANNTTQIFAARFHPPAGW